MMKISGIQLDKLQAISGQIGVALFVLGFVNAAFIGGTAWGNIAVAFTVATAAIVFAIIE